MSSSGLSVDMRHTKLSAADAALIAGEVTKPSWASRNEGIHERISFDDTLWGFDLAGGSFYKTPLRVVAVKPGSRAELACIKKGDTVKRINGIDTATLTLQEAHDIILHSGIHLKIAVTSPDDEDDAYYTYEDPIVDEAALEEQRRRDAEAERIRRAIERASRASSYPWPWVKRTNIIYRESNCFLVPSKYENLHKEKYPELPHIRYTDDISAMIRGTAVNWDEKSKKNGVATPETQEKGTAKVTDNASVMDEKEADKIINEILEEGEEVNKNLPSDVEEPSHSDADDTTHGEMNGEVAGPDNEEDGLGHPETQQVNDIMDEEVDKLRSISNNENDILEEENVIQPAETEMEQMEESSSIANNVEDASDSLDNLDESLEQNEVEVNPPASDYVNEDELTKLEEEHVVDAIVGDGEDSTNER